MHPPPQQQQQRQQRRSRQQQLAAAAAMTARGLAAVTVGTILQCHQTRFGQQCGSWETVSHLQFGLKMKTKRQGKSLMARV
jgi:hypothetical protein